MACFGLLFLSFFLSFFLLTNTRAVEMTAEEEACDILHFPVASADRPGGALRPGAPMDLDYRYLGQVAGIAAFPGDPHGRMMLQVGGWGWGWVGVFAS
jgi:hypothetical protein